MDSAWLWRLGVELDRPPLLLFPHAGGSASAFAELAARAQEHFDVLGVQYPGRGPRYAEPGAATLTTLADDIADHVLGHKLGSISLLGHSMGAIVAYEVAWRLQSAGRQPLSLVVSGARAPHTVRLDIEPLHTYSRQELARALAQRGGIPAELAAEPDALDIFLPAIQHDFALIADYVYGPEPRVVRCPIAALGGSDDPVAQLANLRRWADLTTRAFTATVLPGGHFFHQGNEAAVVSALRRSLRSSPVSLGCA